MRDILTILHITLHEAGRRRVLTATLIGAAAFLLLYGIGFHFVARKVMTDGGLTVVRQRLFLNFLTLAGLYVSHFLALMTAVLLPVDTLSGDIASGVVQTVATKPVARSSIVLGKWLAFSLVAVAYYMVVALGVLAIARVLGHFTPPGLAVGMPLMALEAVVFVSISIAGGATLATVTNGVLVFGLYGLAFIGTWVEQVGAIAGNQAAQNVGTIASLIMPTEALWQRAAYHMQPAMMRDLHMTPFSPASLPSPAMVWWAAGYALVALALGVRAFEKRAL
jgi:ABC-type transport system involved in multi-copper enzyme maturation permease subunit